MTIEREHVKTFHMIGICQLFFNRAKIRNNLASQNTSDMNKSIANCL